MLQILCCQSECCDPRIHPTLPKNLRNAAITFFVLMVISLILTLTMHQGGLTTPLLAGGTALFFLITIVLLKTKRWGDSLPPLTSKNYEDAVSSRNFPTLFRYSQITTQPSMRVLTGTMEQSEGNILHTLAASTDHTDADRANLDTLVKQIISNNFEALNQRETGGMKRTPLHIAGEKNNTIMFQILIANGADQSLGDANRKPPALRSTSPVVDDE